MKLKVVHGHTLTHKEKKKIVWMIRNKQTFSGTDRKQYTIVALAGPEQRFKLKISVPTRAMIGVVSYV